MKTNSISLKILFLLLCFSKQSKANDLTADSLQLVALYNTMNGPNWNSPWDLTQAVETWEGIVLSNDNCHVTAIDLGNNNLVGELFDLNLPSLETLNLSQNTISGNIPDFNLPELKVLSLYSNNLVGTVPNFSNLSKLESLNLSYKFLDKIKL